MSDLARWLATRVPEAPAELRDHLVVNLGGSRAVGLAPADQGSRAVTGSPRSAERVPQAATDALIAATDASLARVLDSGAASRDSALDLLSADAFITYAFEAAADEPGSVAAHADAAMRQISYRAVTYLDKSSS